MLIRGLFSISAVFLSLALGIRGHGQEIYRLRNAPFTATQVWVSKDRQNINKVARASDGSIYIASFDAQGSLQWVTIEDAPHRRVIVLQAKARVYTVTVRSPTDLETYSLEQWTEVMKASGNQGTGHTDLGTRTELSMTLYGNRLEFGGDVIERWDSLELGATYKSRTTDSQGLKVEFTLSNIERLEPDPALFEIPPGYTPAKVVNRSENAPRQ